jgi:hypothetical protein
VGVKRKINPQRVRILEMVVLAAVRIGVSPADGGAEAQV